MIAKGKILIVDDHYSSGELVKAILEKEGYSVHVEQSGESAIFNMNVIQPDIILLDLWMPGMNGFEVCEMLKEEEQTKEIPIIFLSATIDTHEKVKGFQLGAVDFISKPFEETELLARVQTHLKISRMQVQLEEQAMKLANFNQQLEMEIYQNKKAEERLRKFILGIENTNDAIFITNVQGEIEYINAAFEKIYGFSSLEAIGKTPRILKSGLLTREDYENFWNTLLSKKSISGELINKTKDGNLITIEETTTPIVNNEDELIGFISINRDITERKKLLEEVQNEKKLLRTLIDIIPDAIYIKDALGRKMVANQADLNIMNATDESEILGKTDLEVLSGKIAEMGYDDDMKVIKTGVPILSHEDQFVKANGESFWLLTSKIPITNSEGKVTGLVGVGRDITHEKKQSEALLLSESKYRSLFESNPAPMWIYDLNTLRILEVNHSAVSGYGYSRQEFLQMTIKDIRPAEDVEALLRDVESTSSILNKAGIWRHQKKNGEIILVEIISHFIEFENREARLVITNDVTTRVKAEEAIHNERKLLRTLIDHLPVTIYVKDKECRKIVANRLDLLTIGVTDEKQVLGKTDLELFDDEIGQRGYNDDLWVIRTGQAVVDREEVFFDSNGSPRVLLTSKIPLFDQHGHTVGLVGIGNDITRLKIADEQIIKLSTALEQSPLSILITNTEGQIEYVNPKLVQITGYTHEELKGQNPRIFKSGEKTAEEYKDLWETISSGKEWHGEFHDRKKNGELYWESVTISPVFDGKGKIINYIAIKEDITHQKQLMNELVQSKEKAEESDRLKSAFLANMSHEIRTPLNGILGFSELIVDPEIDAAQKTEMAKQILENGDLLLTIINDVLDISKIEAGQITLNKTTFDAYKLIGSVFNSFLLKAQEKHLKLIVATGSDSSNLPLNSDFMRLNQVLGNLVGNAIKYTSAGTVEMGCYSKASEVVFYVKDSGIGILPENQEKIFERFNREEAYTKEIGGAGLGLSIARSFVEMLGGKIWVESEKGRGSCFYFTIPNSSV